MNFNVPIGSQCEAGDTCMYTEMENWFGREKVSPLLLLFEIFWMKNWVGGGWNHLPSPSTVWDARIQRCTYYCTWVKGCCKGFASSEQ